MKIERIRARAGSVVAALLGLVVVGIGRDASASLVDFEAEGAIRGGVFTGRPDSPMTIGLATFTGGEILRHESGLNADASAVYASYDIASRAYDNPIRIAFAGPVESLSLLVTNTTGGSFTVADDRGGSMTLAVGIGASTTFTLPTSGVNAVTITSLGRGSWDFAVDDVTFSPDLGFKGLPADAPALAPEPSTLLAGLVGAMVPRWRRVG